MGSSMPRRAFLRTSALTASGMTLAAWSERRAQAEGETKPNVLLIVSDDLNCRLGCFGDPVAKTPHLDGLAARGVRFERAYCQYPLCNPSRTSFLSGRRPESTQVLDNTTDPRVRLKSEKFLPDYLRENGYFTARLGKITHGPVADPIQKWDLVDQVPQGAKDFAAGKKPAKEGQPTGPIPWKVLESPEEDEDDGRTARRAAELLAERREKPLFLAVGFHKPHAPLNAPKKYFDLYPPDKLSLSDEPADDRKDIPAVALTKDRAVAANERRQIMAAYYACISFMDAQVGVVLEALTRQKLWEQTVVVFFGDHGWHLGEHGGLWAKHTLFEESLRVPLIVAAPGKRAAASSTGLVELIDVYPSLAELCALKAPPGLEGKSLVPLLGDPGREGKTEAFSMVSRGPQAVGRSIRTARFRYTDWGAAGAAELYDLDADPHAYTNRANDPSFRDRVADLKGKLEASYIKP